MPEISSCCCWKTEAMWICNGFLCRAWGQSFSIPLQFKYLFTIKPMHSFLMTLSWQWASAFRWFTAFRDSGAAWHAWPHFIHLLLNPDSLVNVPPAAGSSLALTYPPLWERLPLDLVKGRLHHPACSRDSNDDSLSLLAPEQVLSLPEPINISHSSSSSPWVREPSLWVTKRIHRYRWPVWEDGAPRAQLLLLQLWGSSSLL